MALKTINGLSLCIEETATDGLMGNACAIVHLRKYFFKVHNVNCKAEPEDLMGIDKKYF